uniref:Reverse transcriptase/retrotransposon-derived protein RNase H-like domain-containing protein n=1 Tax=Tanacetum cinerariifolium TaxID=118510 RepID=A0A6L2NK25_TANCI|nr:hypothetical protein [Tanacetum cinerariifolium]
MLYKLIDEGKREHEEMRAFIYSRVPIILGRPFLVTGRTMIDVFNKKIMLRVGDDEMIFDVDQSIKRPPTKHDECYGIDDLDDTINVETQELLANDEPDLFLSRGLEKSIDQSNLEDCEPIECNIDNDSNEPIWRIASINMPYSIVQETTEPVKLEREDLYSVSANEIDEKKHKLKDLPNHLEYTYLHGDKSFPIIISFKLSDKEKILILQVLEKRKGERLLGKCQTSRESVPHSLWVRPIHIVPKNGGMTMVLNDNNELILSRTVTGWRVDRAKIDVIAKLPYPTNVKGVRGFLGDAGFYRRFIKDFSLISKPMTNFLMKDAKFDFFDDCKKAFNILKENLTTAPIIILPDWNVPFELMCDASDFAVGAVLGQRIDGKFKPIYYASKTLNNAQEHYTTIEKELLAVVFSFDNFCPYLVLLKTIVYTDHSDLKYLFSKQDAIPRLIRLENLELSTLTEEEIADEFFDEHLMALKTEINNDEPWYADYVNYLVGKIMPPNWTPEKRRIFFSQVKNYFCDEPYALKPCLDNKIRRCVAGNKISGILAHCHSRPSGGHHSASVIGRKVYESGFF